MWKHWRLSALAGTIPIPSTFLPHQPLLLQQAVCRWQSTATGRLLSKSGAADCLEALGVNIMITPGQSTKLLESIGICFLFAQTYHASMKYVAPVRKELASELSLIFWDHYRTLQVQTWS